MIFFKPKDFVLPNKTDLMFFFFFPFHLHQELFFQIHKKGSNFFFTNQTKFFHNNKSKFLTKKRTHS